MRGKQVYVPSIDHIKIQVKTKGLYLCYGCAGSCRLFLHFFLSSWKETNLENLPVGGAGDMLKLKLDIRPTEKSLCLYWFVPFISLFAFSPFQRYTRFSWTCEKRNSISSQCFGKKTWIDGHFGRFHEIVQSPCEC